MKNCVLLLFECNKASQSDYMYVKRVLNNEYCTNNRHLVPLYAGTKTNLYSESMTKKIAIAIKKCGVDAVFNIIIFADVDSNQGEDAKRNQALLNYKPFSFNQYIVWFNHDIEEVMIGKRISAKDKVKCAENFFKNKDTAINMTVLKNSNPLNSIKTSNLILVLDKVFDKKK